MDVGTNVDLLPSSEGFSGINLANYFPNRRSYNSVVYLHKRLLSKTKKETTKDIKKDEKIVKRKNKKKKTGVNMKLDKSQQFNSETMNQQSYKYETVETAYNNSVLDETIRFSKNLIPLLIPKESAPVFYTIKSSQKHRKRDKNPRESNIEKEVTYNKDNLKKHVDRSCKNNKECSDPSSQNTLDDLRININQSCSFSESTKVKMSKKTPNNFKVTSESSQKCCISSSFEALATESYVDGSKIKIHLMNDADKKKFSESIQNPIINTIKDYITHLNFSNKDINRELKSVQRLAKSNSEKLDDILEKLACIQTEIDNHAKIEAATSKVQSDTALRLDEVEHDLIEIKEHSSEEEDLTEEYNNMLKRSRDRGKSIVVAIEEKNIGKKVDKKEDSIGCGKIPGHLNSTSLNQLVKPDRLNRIPAKFCWTDGDKKTLKI